MGIQNYGLNRAVIGLCAALCAGGAWAQSSEDSPAPANPAAVSAVWKAQEFNFHYFGRTSRYSCDGLRDKLRALLLEVGIWKEPELTTAGCVYGRLDLTVQPLVHVKLYSLVPAASEAGSVPVLSKHPRAAAATRKKKNIPPSADAIIAHYQPFSFKPDSFRNLEEGDCELMEEFSHQVLPKLTTRDLKTDTRCVPYQRTLGSYRLEGEVLKPMAATSAAAH